MKEKTSSDVTQFNIRKNDFVRVILQALQSLDFKESAKLLEKESGILLHSAAVNDFRQFVLEGKWDNVIKALDILAITDEDKRKNVKFLIYRQKYLELLEMQKVKEAVHTVRNELAQVTSDASQLHQLTSLIMCQTSDHIKSRAHWQGSTLESRQELLDSLQKYIPSTLMVPENRLQKLIIQAVEAQQDAFLVRESDSDNMCISLLQDETQAPDVVPCDAVYILEDHNDEVWHLQWSPCGKYIATASADKTALIYDVSKLSEQNYRPAVLQGHTDTVSYVSWSPDSTMLLTCSNDKHIKLWNVQTATCIRTYSKHKDVASAVVWMPDNKHFFSAGSKADKTIRRWNINGDQIDAWKLNFRIHDIAMSKDGSKLVVASHNKKIHVYAPDNKSQCYTLNESEYVSAITLSQCGRFALCSVAHDEETGKGSIHLWDLEERRMIREFNGNKQTKIVLRTCFGGARNSFVISGSEDSKVYIWDRHSAKLLHTLEGHVNFVNAVSWNPKTAMFASASDDHTVRVWGVSKM